ncbi:sigma-70 family RNA polymerase sigma factor [Emcibacter sp. SYSU 3D8]|uniref:sigma-70 family RNA polymerase sigma factor n=1 Tax=Emcibacter sp. SYSU 3D8 TaxID=3133969 RepID=UPI0031FE971E
MTARLDESTADFESHRRRLTGLAYRMLGSLSEAEDIVQEAWLRWHGTDRAALREPAAWLSRVVTRLCLDQMKSARARRETYVGPWLPEPVLGEAALAPDAASERAEDISVAFLLALERLSPLERAAFLLHDVFEMDFADVARTLDREEPACRQLASRARTHLKSARTRFAVPQEEGERLVRAFLVAAGNGDTDAFARLLTADAALHSDGGGKRLAALNVINGRDRVARFFIGITRKGHWPSWRIRPESVNGMPGLVMTDPDGEVQTVAFQIADGAISAIYIVRNPDKLRHLA